MEKITAIILAGGKSSRMGEDKGMLKINNISMVEMIIKTVTPMVSKIIIISNNQEYLKFNTDVFPDLIKNKGPVGGIYTGLNYTKTGTNIVLSCDTPFVSQSLLKLLLDSSKKKLITIPKYNEKLHSLIGIYKKNALPYFKESIENGFLKLGLVNKNLNCKIVNVSLIENASFFNEKTFVNVNTKKDLEKINNEYKG